MGVTVLSIQAQTNKPAEAIRRISAGLSRIESPAGFLAFASGTLGSCLQTLAELVRKKLPKVPALFAASDGVFTEQGEVEDQDGLVCLMLGGTKLRVMAGPESLKQCLTEPGAMAEVASGWPKMLLTTSQGGPPNSGGVPEETFAGWFGAVTSSDAPLWGLDADGDIHTGAAAVVEFPSREPPLLVASPCCRLITRPTRVSSAEGATVFELDGVPALVALGQASSKLVDRSWIVVALSEDPNCVPMTNDGSPNLVFRPVRGIDPARGAILLTEPVSMGTQLAFAVRDDRAARRSLEEALRFAKYRLRGGSPKFGVYFDGLGRGRSLYGTSNVDLGLVRQALGEFPIIGMRSAFELRSDVGGAGTQTLTGQLALFSNPS